MSNPIRDALAELVRLAGTVERAHNPTWDAAWGSARAALAASEQAVPSFRGYAHLGTGQYLIDHSAAGEPAELIISIATEAEKIGRTVNDEKDHGFAEREPIQPDVMAVRLRFENVAGLDALERQLRYVRRVHFPESAQTASDRLHNIFDAISRDADGSEWSREEWDRIDTENAALRQEVARTRAALVASEQGAQPVQYDDTAPPIWEQVAAIGKSAPPEAWKSAPQPVQEPVAWRVRRSDGQHELFFHEPRAQHRAECFVPRSTAEPLYANPQPVQKPLTDEQIEALRCMLLHYGDDPRVQCLRGLAGWTVAGEPKP